jgi:hypothetical protein
MQWVNRVATCVLCKTQYHEFRYNPDLVGTFPREEAEEYPRTVAYTSISLPYKTSILDEEDWK